MWAPMYMYQRQGWCGSGVIHVTVSVCKSENHLRYCLKQGLLLVFPGQVSIYLTLGYVTSLLPVPHIFMQECASIKHPLGTASMLYHRVQGSELRSLGLCGKCCSQGCLPHPGPTLLPVFLERVTSIWMLRCHNKMTCNLSDFKLKRRNCITPIHAKCIFICWLEESLRIPT